MPHLFSQDVYSLKRTATRTTSGPATLRWETETPTSFSGTHVTENTNQENLTNLRVTHKWFAFKND